MWCASIAVATGTSSGGLARCHYRCHNKFSASSLPWNRERVYGAPYACALCFLWGLQWQELTSGPPCRYYRPWLDAQSLVDSSVGIGEKGLNRVGYQPQASRDKSLTAFAQLAALRLDVRRCMVSLIDSNRQYILAEATRTVSLFEATAERAEDEVWLGNAVLNKTDAVCYHTFSATYTAKERNGDTITADCMVIPDCRRDPRHPSHPRDDGWGLGGRP